MSIDFHCSNVIRYRYPASGCVAHFDSHFTSFDPVDYDWADIFDNPLNPISDSALGPPLFPPSSPSSSNDLATMEIQKTLPNFSPQAIVGQSPTINGEFEGNTLPTPPPTDTDSQTDLQTTPSSPVEQRHSLSYQPPRRRGPGRPSKAQLATQGSAAKRSSTIIVRRGLHNDSAIRSRAKFSAVFDELWKEIPKMERYKALKENSAQQASRAKKVEIVILYIKKLQAKVKANKSK